jgi:hypothetical protein
MQLQKELERKDLEAGQLKEEVMLLKETGETSGCGVDSAQVYWPAVSLVNVID